MGICILCSLDNIVQNFPCFNYLLKTINMQFKGVLFFAFVFCTTVSLCDNQRWSFGKLQPLSKDHCTTDDDCHGEECCMDEECFPEKDCEKDHCYEDNDCTHEECCLDGRCHPEKDCGEECYDDFDCSNSDCCTDSGRCRDIDQCDRAKECLVSNDCPHNYCCSIYGHCGTDPEFCHDMFTCYSDHDCTNEGECCSESGHCGLGPEYCGTSQPYHHHQPRPKSQPF